MLIESCCLCGRPATAATSCSFCQAGKYNSDNTGTSSCTSCVDKTFQTCTSSKDCEYEGCVHPDTPVKAKDTNTKCFSTSEVESGNDNDNEGNPLAAKRCYAVKAEDENDFFLCPAKDKVRGLCSRALTCLLRTSPSSFNISACRGC